MAIIVKQHDESACQTLLDPATNYRVVSALKYIIRYPTSRWRFFSFFSAECSGPVIPKQGG